MHMTTKALVLRQVDYKESDKILTLFTQEQGKLTASARGCRKRGAPWPRHASYWPGQKWCYTTTRGAGP